MDYLNCTCSYCNVKFHKKPSHIKENNFCCKDHYSLFQRKEKIKCVCKKCNKVFYVHDSKIKCGGKYCSCKCFQKATGGKKRNKNKEISIFDDYALLPLTKNQMAIIDLEDVNEVIKFNWCASFNKSNNTYYAVRKNCEKGPQQIRLGNFLLNYYGKDYVDHINHNTLDYRKSNLRRASYQGNSANSRKLKIGSSRYKGVSWDRSRSKWRVQIMLNRKNIFIGRFELEEEAAIAYNEKAKELFGEFAYLNEI